MQLTKEQHIIASGVIDDLLTRDVDPITEIRHIQGMTEDEVSRKSPGLYISKEKKDAIRKSLINGLGLVKTAIKHRACNRTVQIIRDEMNERG